MKIAIIGGGSIGLRHKRLLEDFGYEVLLVSQHFERSKNVLNSVEELFLVNSIEYIIIANETYKHTETVRIIKESAFKGLLLVEKPLNSNLELVEYSQFKESYVGFNLRFHPAVIRLKTLVEIHRNEILGVEMHYGNSTSNWRPDALSRESYSRSAALGGGVLRDFCHEIDLAHWLFGFEKVEYAYGAKHGEFMIDGENLVCLTLGGIEMFKISISLNSLQNLPTRTITLHTIESEYKVDLINASLTYGDSVEKFEIDSDYTYQKMHEAILSGDSTLLATIKDGLSVDKIISDAESLFEIRKL
jgi:predicted dehydrogenase